MMGRTAEAVRACVRRRGIPRSDLKETTRVSRRPGCVFFEHAPFPTGGGLPRINSRSADVQSSLVAGKNAGNFAESAVFWQNPSRKPLL